MHVIHGPHDKIFKRVMADRENAISLLKNILPGPVREMLDLNKMRYEKDTFLPAHLKEYFSDLLTSVPVKDSKYEVKVYFLFEHKSYFVTNYPLQILRYILEIWSQYESTGSKLPLIIPVLITHPEGGWRRKNISDLVEIPSDEFKAFIPDFEHVLYDSASEDPDKYEFVETLKALLVIWKHFDSPDFMRHLEIAFRLVKKLHPETRFKDFVTSFMEYLIQTRRKEEYIEIQKIAEKEFSGGDNLMQTIAEMFRNEGVQDGLQQGVVMGELKKAKEMLIKSLLLRFEIVKPSIKEQIRSIDSLDQVNDLFEISFKCTSMEDFTGYLQKMAE